MALVSRQDRPVGERRAAVLTLDRPEARNAMSTALVAELLDAVAEADGDPGVAVVVLTGAGGAFSGGADLHEELDHDGRVRRMELLCELYEAVAEAATPTVAAVEGACVGGGVELACACDLRVVADGARLRFPGAAIGYPVGAAKLVALVGLGTAKDLTLTSRVVDAEEAGRTGLAQRVVPEGRALDEALGLAGQVAANHPEAVGALKRQLSALTGQVERLGREADLLRALAESGGDYTALHASGRWAGGYTGRGAPWA